MRLHLPLLPSPGTALVTLSDSESASSGSTSAWGDVLVVLSAALYGGYTVIMRKKMPGEEEGAQVALFFGYLGLFNTVSAGRAGLLPACG